MSRHLVPQAMAGIAMATPHIMGTDTRELIETMARQRLEEGPTPLLQARHPNRNPKPEPNPPPNPTSSWLQHHSSSW